MLEFTIKRGLLLEAMNHIFLYRLWRKAGFNSFAEYVGDLQGRLLASYRPPFPLRNREFS